MTAFVNNYSCLITVIKPNHRIRAISLPTPSIDKHPNNACLQQYNPTDGRHIRFTNTIILPILCIRIWHKHWIHSTRLILAPLNREQIWNRKLAAQWKLGSQAYICYVIGWTLLALPQPTKRGVANLEMI